jgi:hypothetical protein
MLMEAKSRLPHGQYLPWVAAGVWIKNLSQKLALIKAAEWDKLPAHVPGHLDQITGTAQVLFLLSVPTPRRKT